MAVIVKRLGLSKGFRFEAAHHIPGYVGKCARVHGHSYHGRVTVQGDVDRLNKLGILVDFTLVKQAIQECIITPFDHQNLNEVGFEQPTAETIVQEIWQRLFKWFCKSEEAMGQLCGSDFLSVRLYEEPDCWVDFPVTGAAVGTITQRNA